LNRTQKILGNIYNTLLALKERRFHAGFSGASPLERDQCFYLHDHWVGGALRGSLPRDIGATNRVSNEALTPKSSKHYTLHHKDKYFPENLKVKAQRRNLHRPL
jgi:hypothetical protein